MPFWLSAARQMKMIIIVPGGILHHRQTSRRSASVCGLELHLNLIVTLGCPASALYIRRGHDSERSGKKCIVHVYNIDGLSSEKNLTLA